MKPYLNMREIVEKWRSEVLPGYCGDCAAACCHLNLEDLTAEQAGLICPKFEDELNADGQPMFYKNNGLYRTNFWPPPFDSCPQLKNHQCGIYDHPLRPEICRDFPLFIWGSERRIVRHNQNCPAASLSNLADLWDQAQAKGYQLQNAFGIKEITSIQIRRALRAAGKI